MTVADQARAFFQGVAIVMSIIGIISFLGMFGGDVNVISAARKWTFFTWPILIVFWLLWIFTPSKRDSLFIVAGGGVVNYLAQDSTAKQIPHELLEFTRVNLLNLAQDANVQLEVNEQKAKIIKEAKGMTATELLDRMKVDTNFAQLILKQ
jgi:hypothetical protein